MSRAAVGKKVLVAGAAGFIGEAVCRRLLYDGFRVVGLDNLTDYYDVRLKRYRLAGLRRLGLDAFLKIDCRNDRALERVFRKHRFDAVINLAAQAGVPLSLTQPHLYVTTNTLGALSLLEACRKHRVGQYLLASTSSVYTGQPTPYKESLPSNRPFSPYAASKIGAEAMAHAYHYNFGIKVQILRFFTVYGPAGRPDMSYFKFIESLLRGRPLPVNGDGRQCRDFTYIDDIADGAVRAMSLKGFHVINLGSDRPQSVNGLIGILEKETGTKAKIRTLPALRVDPRVTWANISVAKRLLGWRPRVTFAQGLQNTVRWHLSQRKLLSGMAV